MTESMVIDTFELQGPVREMVTKIVALENPLPSGVTFDKSMFNVDNENVFITPESFTIPPKREGVFEINYRPLIVASQEGMVVAKSPDLGDYKYKLSLKGLKSTSQKYLYIYIYIYRSLHFKTALGTELVQVFRFYHYLKKQTVYTLKLEKVGGGASTDFRSEQPNIPGAPAESMQGIELAVNIRYEPNNLGESRGILIITNPEGIEYSCLLFGHATAPQPQGPFKVQHQKTVNVDFRNPLSEKCEFNIRFDNPSFTIGGKPPGVIDVLYNIYIYIYMYIYSLGRARK